MTDSDHRVFWARLRPEIAGAWSLMGYALDTRTPTRARQHAAACRAATSLPAVAEVLVDVAEAHWHPALTVAAVHLLDALHAAEREDNPSCSRLARRAARELMRHWGELKAEGDLRGVGAQLGDQIDGYLTTRPTQPPAMLAQAWSELPLIDAFVATAAALSSNQPRTWSPGQVAAVLGAWDQLRATLPLPEASQRPWDGARQAAQIQRRLDVARMLLSAYPTGPSSDGTQTTDPALDPALYSTPSWQAPANPAPTDRASARAAMVTPAEAFESLRTAGALLSQLLGPAVTCDEHNQLVGHWTIDTPVVKAWNCLRHTAHEQPAPRGQRATWSAVRALTLPDAPMAAAIQRYQRLDWRGTRYYARQVTSRAERCRPSSPPQTGTAAPATAVEDTLPSTDPPGPEPRAGPDLA